MPPMQQQQVGSRGRCSLPLLLLLLLLSFAARPSQAAIHIPSNCEYRLISYQRWLNASIRFKDLFVVLITLLIHQSMLIMISHYDSFVQMSRTCISLSVTSIFRVGLLYCSIGNTTLRFIWLVLICACGVSNYFVIDPLTQH